MRGLLAHLVAAMWLAACLAPADHICADGTVCPIDRVCVVGGCALPEQLAACDGLPEDAPCTFAGTAGACMAGVCVGSLCGNGAIDVGELCDDGNRTGGDGCGPSCQLEVCGNGITDHGEACDDGNTADRDGCSASCQSDETCGNSIVDVLVGEECDDGAHLSHDGCSSDCRLEVPTWTPQPLPMPGRSGHHVAYDAARKRIVVFSGFLDGSGAADTWEWNGAWTQRFPSTSPPAISNGAMAYDANRERTVLFGGRDAIGSEAVFSTTWEWDGTTWTNQTPTTPSPPPRLLASMAYDARRKVVVLFGGLDASFSVLNDTWIWNGTTWTQVAVGAGPPARAGQGMAYDPVRDAVLVFGGNDGDRDLADTWRWNGMTWVDVTPAGSPPAGGTSELSYDAAGRRIVLTTVDVNEAPFAAQTWEWNGTVWTDVTDTAGTLPVFRHRLAYDVARERMVSIGGLIYDADSNLVPANALFERAHAEAWVERGFTAPRPRASPLARDPNRNRFVLFGGEPGPGQAFLADTWERDGALWQLMTPAVSPPRRAFHALVHDPIRGTELLFGGRTEEFVAFGDLWEWDGETWTERTPSTGPNPPPRSALGAAYDTGRRRLVIFGGFNSISFLADTWEWDGTQWFDVTPDVSPAPRRGHQLEYDPVRGRVVLFGGGETWEWDGATWTERDPNHTQAIRTDFSMAFNPFRGRVTEFGGFSGPTVSDQTNEWNGVFWTGVTPAGVSPAARIGAGIAADGLRGGLLLLGGQSSVADPREWVFRFQRHDSGGEETCDGLDGDGDGLIGCTDPDCWGRCAPYCPPNATCDASMPHCGDGVCNDALETCTLCSADCGACPPEEPPCGNFVCDPGETVDDCPGDC
jgi:cysteine-rich repeat protein